MAAVDEFIVACNEGETPGSRVGDVGRVLWVRDQFEEVIDSGEVHVSGENGEVRVGDGRSLVYLYHDGGSGVRVENSDRLLNALPGEFEAYNVDALSFDELFAVFRDADVIIGAHGPWLTGLLWCSSLDLFVEILPPNPSPVPYQLACVTGGTYAGVAYPLNASGDRVHVSVDEVVELVRQNATAVNDPDRGGPGRRLLGRLQHVREYVTGRRE